MLCFRSFRATSAVQHTHSLALSYGYCARGKHTPAIGRKRREAAKKPEEEKDVAINWYPGHIAKVRTARATSHLFMHETLTTCFITHMLSLQAEKELAGMLKKVDVVVEVRDARIPASTAHPSIPQWVGPHKTVIVVRAVVMSCCVARGWWSQCVAPPTPRHSSISYQSTHLLWLILVHVLLCDVRSGGVAHGSDVSSVPGRLEDLLPQAPPLPATLSALGH